MDRMFPSLNMLAFEGVQCAYHVLYYWAEIVKDVHPNTGLDVCGSSLLKYCMPRPWRNSF